MRVNMIEQARKFVEPSMPQPRPYPTTLFAPSPGQSISGGSVALMSPFRVDASSEELTGRHSRRVVAGGQM